MIPKSGIRFSEKDHAQTKSQPSQKLALDRQRVPIRSHTQKKGRLAPALKHLGIECTLALGPGPFRLRGAGGLRNPSRESRPGPEATVLRIAGQVDPRSTEFRPHYDSIDEHVSCLPPPC